MVPHELIFFKRSTLPVGGLSSPKGTPRRGVFCPKMHYACTARASAEGGEAAVGSSGGPDGPDRASGGSARQTPPFRVALRRTIGRRPYVPPCRRPCHGLAPPCRRPSHGVWPPCRRPCHGLRLAEGQQPPCRRPSHEPSAMPALLAQQPDRPKGPGSCRRQRASQAPEDMRPRLAGQAPDLGRSPGGLRGACPPILTRFQQQAGLPAVITSGGPQGRRPLRPVHPPLVGWEGLPQAVRPSQTSNYEKNQEKNNKYQGLAITFYDLLEK